jgi:hypothetical protein
VATGQIVNWISQNCAFAASAAKNWACWRGSQLLSNRVYNCPIIVQERSQIVICSSLR